MSGQNEREALRSIETKPINAHDALNRLLDEYYQSYSGVGKDLVQDWNSTGYQVEINMNEFVAKITDFSAKFQELPEEELQELQKNLQTSLDQLIESKGAAAD